MTDSTWRLTLLAVSLKQLRNCRSKSRDDDKILLQQGSLHDLAVLPVSAPSQRF
jgi:hypothetical protein